MRLSGTRALLVLWDIDGTLIHNGGVSKMAYARGYELLTGHAPTLPVITDGQTDVGIMRSLLNRHGLAATPDLLARVVEVMPQALAGLVPELRSRGRAKAGAKSAITALRQEPDVIQSVLTGNVAANGYAKLATFGLDVGLDFEVGGYGSDHEVRAELVAAARAKVLTKYRVDVCVHHVVLIGDTPRDVEAARLSGAFSFGVASGEFDSSRLEAEGADAVLPDLTDTALVVATVLAARRGTR